MEIKLLVLRTADIQKLAAFYAVLGLTFEYHKHDNSPYHFSTLIDKTIIEIYPLAKNQTEPDKNLRLGFSVDNFSQIISTLKESEIVFTEPASTDFGFMTIVTDPDGRKIELYKK